VIIEFHSTRVTGRRDLPRPLRSLPHPAALAVGVSEPRMHSNGRNGRSADLGCQVLGGTGDGALPTGDGCLSKVAVRARRGSHPGWQGSSPCRAQQAGSWRGTGSRGGERGAQHAARPADPSWPSRGASAVRQAVPLDAVVPAPDPGVPISTCNDLQLECTAGRDQGVRGARVPPDAPGGHAVAFRSIYRSWAGSRRVRQPRTRMGLPKTGGGDRVEDVQRVARRNQRFCCLLRPERLGRNP